VKKLPENWRMKTIGEMIKFSGGSQPPRSNFVSTPQEGYVRLIQIRDYKTDKFATYIPSGMASKFCDKEDIMIGRYGPPIFQILRGLSGAYNVALIKAIPQNGLLSRYAYHFLKSPSLYNFIDSLSQRSSGQTGIEMDELKDYPLPLPPEEEQRVLADVFDKWDHSIDLTENLIAAKQERRTWLMHQLLTGKRRLSGFGKPAPDGGTPEGWQTPKTDAIFRNISKKNCPGETVLSVTQDAGVVARDSLERKINMSHENTHTYKLVEPGDFVISLRSFQGGLEYSRYRGLVSPAYHVIRPKVKICDDFFRLYFKSNEFIQRLAIATIGIRDGKQISFEDFAFMKIPVPPLDEQQKIAAVIDTADRELDLLRFQLDALRDQKKGLMQQLLTGKLRVKV